MIQGVSAAYLVKCFLKRADSQGTESGAKQIPSTRGSTLPGVSGQVNLYRGYALQYTTWAGPFGGSESNIIWTDITGRLPWIFPGMKVTMRVGLDSVITGTIQQTSGVFGGLGIDEILYDQIQGIPMIISGGTLNG
jgi:hypothetical protein